MYRKRIKNLNLKKKNYIRYILGLWAKGWKSKRKQSESVNLRYLKKYPPGPPERGGCVGLVKLRNFINKNNYRVSLEAAIS